MQQPVRLGILGPGAIFRRVMTDLPNFRDVRVTAVASHNAQRAQQAAALCGAQHIFTSYEDLAACPDVDLVYIATPHLLHKEQALMCMRHKKHVLCEKPLALNEQETAEMAACAREEGVFLMEAMWTRFFPAAVRVRELVRSGAIGEVQHVEAKFSYRSVGLPETHRLLNPELAGGGLLDVGVYALEAIMDVLGSDPSAVQGLCIPASTGVDARFSVQMLYPTGATAHFLCGIDVSTDSTQMIYGTLGRIEIPDFWHPTRFCVHYATGETQTHTFRPENEGHHYEFDHAAQCIRQGLSQSPVMPLEESIAAARIMTRLRHEQGIFYPQEERHGKTGSL